MNYRIKLGTSVLLNILIFSNPLLTPKLLTAAAPAPTFKSWVPGKPWTVLRETTVKLRDYLKLWENSSGQACPATRDWLDDFSRQTRFADADVWAACRFWCNWGTFAEMDDFWSREEPQKCAVKAPDGVLTHQELSRWLEASDAPDSEDSFFEFVNGCAVRAIGCKYAHLLPGIGPNFFTDIGDAHQSSFNACQKAAVFGLLTDEMRRFEAGVGGGLWKKYFESGASPADRRATYIHHLNKLWADSAMRALYAEERGLMLADMMGAFTLPPEQNVPVTYRENGTDLRTAGNRLYQSVRDYFYEVYSPAKWASVRPPVLPNWHLVVNGHAFAKVSDSGHTGAALMRYSGRYKLMREMLGPFVRSPIVQQDQLGEEISSSMSWHYLQIRGKLNGIKDGSFLRSLIRNSVSLDAALAFYAEEVAGYATCLKQADLDLLNAALLETTATVFLEESVQSVTLDHLRVLLLNAKDEIDRTKVEGLLNQILAENPLALNVDANGGSVTKDFVFKVLKTVWDVSAKQPASLLSALDKTRTYSGIAKDYPGLEGTGRVGALHLLSGFFAAGGLVLKGVTNPSSLTKSPTATCNLVTNAVKTVCTLGEASTKFAKEGALIYTNKTTLKAWGGRLKMAASGFKSAGGIAGSLTGVFGLVEGIAILSTDKPAGALAITASIFGIIEGVASAVEGGIAMAGASAGSALSAVGASLSALSTACVIIGAVVVTATVIYGIVQEMQERERAEFWVNSIMSDKNCFEKRFLIEWQSNYQLSGKSSDGSILIGPHDTGPVSLLLKSIGKVFETGDSIYLVFPDGGWMSIPVLDPANGRSEFVFEIDRLRLPARDYSGRGYGVTVYPQGDWLLYGVLSTAPLITVDTTAPTLGAISQVWTNLPSGEVVKTVRGTSEPGAIITVKDFSEATVKGVATAGSDGKWTKDFEWPAAPAASEMWKFSASDRVGNQSASATVLMNTRFPLPAPPDTSFKIQSAFGSRTTPAFLQMLGTGTPGHTIRLTHPFYGVIACVIVGSEGVWSNESASPEIITLLNHSTVIVSVEQYTPAGTMTHRKVVTLSKMQSLPFGRDMVYYTLK